ncbi:MAG: TolC family protein [Armatimonadetes bacterium]|nr:TolC family protein [Armatimonadota bacterium]
MPVNRAVMTFRRRSSDGAERSGILIRALAAALMLASLLALPAHAQLQQEGTGYTRSPRWSGLLCPDDAVRLALTHSLRLAMAREAALEAAARTALAASELRLKLSANAIAVSQNTPMIYATQSMPVYYAGLPGRPSIDGNLVAMLPLFTGGRLDGLLAAARENEKAALALTAAELVDVARNARVAYARALLARDRMDIAAWEVAQREEDERIAERRFKAGAVARNVLYQARAERAGALQSQNEARAEFAREDAALKTVLGIDVASDLQYEDALAAAPAARDEAMEVRAALEGRPDLQAARHGIAAAAREVRAAHGRYAPQIYGMAMLDRVYRDPFSSKSMTEGGYSVGAVLSIPIIDGSARAAEVKMAQSQQRQRQIVLDELELEATRQVRDAVTTLDAARKNAELASEQVTLAQENLRVARLRFEAGRGIHLEELEALRALVEARYNLTKARFAANTARADLLWATGRQEEQP